MLGRKSLDAATDAYELLVAVILADRRHENSSGGQPIDQGRWHFRGRSGHEHALIGRLLGPAFGPVAESANDIAQAQLLEAALGIAQQLAMPFDRKDPAAKMRQNGGLITGTRADLKDVLALAEFKFLGHQRNDIGLADGLAVADRQGYVLIGSVGE